MVDSPRLGDYVLEERIGAGGMAEVFRATAVAGPHAGRTVALKRLLPRVAEDPNYVELLLAEAELTRQLEHPSIIHVLDAGSLHGMHFIVMELIDGRDLNRVLDRCVEIGFRLPIDFACMVAHTVAEALAYAHDARGADGRPLELIHCDVTPSNIFISHLGEIHLGDFGVARSAGFDPRDIFGVVGKSPYLTPEQILRKPLTPATDVFALGTILFEMLTNERAFEGQKTEQIWSRIVAGKRPAPSALRPEVGPDLDAVVLRATAPAIPGERPSPARRALRRLTALPTLPRYPNAGAFADALAPLFDGDVATPLAVGAVMRALFDRG